MRRIFDMKKKYKISRTDTKIIRNPKLKQGALVDLRVNQKKQFLLPKKNKKFNKKIKILKKHETQINKTTAAKIHKTSVS